MVQTITGVTFSGGVFGRTSNYDAAADEAPIYEYRGEEYDVYGCMASSGCWGMYGPENTATLYDGMKIDLDGRAGLAKWLGMPTSGRQMLGIDGKPISPADSDVFGWAMQGYDDGSAAFWNEHWR
jgi:hypothetical protein